MLPNKRQPFDDCYRYRVCLQGKGRLDHLNLFRLCVREENRQRRGEAGPRSFGKNINAAKASIRELPDKVYFAFPFTTYSFTFVALVCPLASYPPYSQPMDSVREQHMETGSSATNVTNAEAYESTHVHAVYEAIAPHFSSTRHSPWPRVAAFLQSQRAGAIGLDVGCGNGKYLDVNPALHILGSDRSNELVRLARTRGSGVGSNPKAIEPDPVKSQSPHSVGGGKPDETHGPGVHGAATAFVAGTEVAVADGLALPYRLAAFDFVICIAVVHHLSTRERRVEAIAELLSRLRPSATADSHAAGTSLPGSGDDHASVSAAPVDGELQRTPGEASSSGDGKATALVFVWALEQSSSRRGWDEGSEQDTLVPWVMRQKGRPNETFQRYYHLYKQGELEEDIVAAGGVVEESGYERDNWWAIFSRPQSQE